MLDDLEELALQVSHLALLVGLFQGFSSVYLGLPLPYMVACFSSLLSRGIFRTFSNIQDEAFFKNSYRLKAVN